MTQEHSVKVEGRWKSNLEPLTVVNGDPIPENAAFLRSYRWTCTCGAKGNLHADSKTAWTFGSEHLRCVAPYVMENER